jgi:hypothetical protein
MLDLPASPRFRLEKEVKNVITVTAKTCHYWVGHVSRERQQAIAELFLAMAEESPLVEPSWDANVAGWRDVECASVPEAIRLMRALVASNVLARREGTTLFVPVNEAVDPGGRRVAAALSVL